MLHGTTRSRRRSASPSGGGGRTSRTQGVQRAPIDLGGVRLPAPLPAKALARRARYGVEIVGMRTASVEVPTHGVGPGHAAEHAIEPAASAAHPSERDAEQHDRERDDHRNEDRTDRDSRADFDPTADVHRLRSPLLGREAAARHDLPAAGHPESRYVGQECTLVRNPAVGNLYARWRPLPPRGTFNDHGLR